MHNTVHYSSIVFHYSGFPNMIFLGFLIDYKCEAMVIVTTEWKLNFMNSCYYLSLSQEFCTTCFLHNSESNILHNICLSLKTARSIFHNIFLTHYHKLKTNFSSSSSYKSSLLMPPSLFPWSVFFSVGATISNVDAIFWIICLVRVAI